MRSKDESSSSQRGPETALQGAVKKGELCSPPDAFLELCGPQVTQGWAFSPYKDTSRSPAGVTDPEAKSKLVATLGNKSLDWTALGPKPGSV